MNELLAWTLHGGITNLRDMGGDVIFIQPFAQQVGVCLSLFSFRLSLSLFLFSRLSPSPLSLLYLLFFFSSLASRDVT